MRADNTAAIIDAARHRHELARARAIRALHELSRAATQVTFDAVARAAGVSRSWLYSQADIRSQIEQLREVTRGASAGQVPARQLASSASLRARLETALQRVRELDEENKRLRRQLAQALGDQRRSRHMPARPAGRSPSGNNPVRPEEADQAPAVPSQTVFTTQPRRSER